LYRRSWWPRRWRLLHETLTFPRFIGSSLITGGCVLAALL